VVSTMDRFRGNMFGFHLAGVVGHDFFKPYAVTFTFRTCRFFCNRSSGLKG
jgi:hypothetical protein